MGEYNRGNEFGQVGAVRGDLFGVCFRKVAKFGLRHGAMLMVVCQWFSRTNISSV